MSVCLARSLAFSIGAVIRAAVRKAAKLAVYDEIKMRQKKYHSEARVLVETALKMSMGVDSKLGRTLHNPPGNAISTRNRARKTTEQRSNWTHRGTRSDPCCIMLPIVNQNAFCRELNWFSGSD